MMTIDDIYAVCGKPAQSSYAAGTMAKDEVRIRKYDGRYGVGWTVEYAEHTGAKRHVIDYYVLNKRGGHRRVYVIIDDTGWHPVDDRVARDVVADLGCVDVTVYVGRWWDLVIVGATDD